MYYNTYMVHLVVHVLDYMCGTFTSTCIISIYDPMCLPSLHDKTSLICVFV